MNEKDNSDKKSDENRFDGKIYLPFRNLGDIDEYIFGECRQNHSEK